MTRACCGEARIVAGLSIATRPPRSGGITLSTTTVIAVSNRDVYVPGSLFVAWIASRNEIPSGPGLAASAATLDTSPFTASELVVTTISPGDGAAAEGATRRMIKAPAARSLVLRLSHEGAFGSCPAAAAARQPRRVDAMALAARPAPGSARQTNPGPRGTPYYSTYRSISSARVQPRHHLAITQPENARAAHHMPARGAWLLVVPLAPWLQKASLSPVPTHPTMLMCS